MRALMFAFGSVILDANGNGTVRLAPAGEKWEVNRMRVECSTNVLESQVKVYQGILSEQYVVGGTWSGSSGDDNDTVYYLEDGTPLFFEWTGGDVGATARVTLSGWKSDPHGGFRAF